MEYCLRIIAAFQETLFFFVLFFVSLFVFVYKSELLHGRGVLQ